MENRILIIAAGGGYDIVSIHYIADWLKQNRNCEIDIAGFQNPKFQHYFEKDNIVSDEIPVRKVNGYKLRRFYRSKSYFTEGEYQSYAYNLSHGEEKDWVDARVAWLTEYDFYSLSTRKSTDELSEFICNYSEVYLCDVGGDILFSGKDDIEVKTPFIDSFSLVILKESLIKKPELKSHVIIIGPGLDLELSPSHLEKNLGSCTIEEKIRIQYDSFNKTTYTLFKKVVYGNSGKSITRLMGKLEGQPAADLIEYGEMPLYLYVLDSQSVIELNPLTKSYSYSEIIELYQSIFGNTEF